MGEAWVARMPQTSHEQRQQPSSLHTNDKLCLLLKKIATDCNIQPKELCSLFLFPAIITMNMLLRHVTNGQALSIG